MTTSDLVLLLIIGEATQQALLGDDFSVTNAVVVIGTLIAAEIALSLLKEWVPGFATALEGQPLVVVADGQPLEREMRWARIDEGDVLEFARQSQGIDRLDDINYARVERDGSISIIPRKPDSGA